MWQFAWLSACGVNEVGTGSCHVGEILIFCITRGRSPDFSHLSSSLVLYQALAVLFNKQWWATPNCKAQMLFLFTDKVAFLPSSNCPFCGFQESNVKSGWFHSGLNFRVVLKFAVKDFCRQYGSLMDWCCIIFPTTCSLQSLVLQLFVLDNQTFLLVFASA